MTGSRFGAVGEWRGNQRFHIGFLLSSIHESDWVKIVQNVADGVQKMGVCVRGSKSVSKRSARELSLTV